MITIHVKHDILHRIYRELSVGLHDKCDPSAFPMIAQQYMAQYAIDNQFSISVLSIRFIDKYGKVVYERLSDASMNKPK